MTNLADRPVWSDAASAALVGSDLGEPALSAAVAAMLADIDPGADTRGPVAFKRHVAGIVAAPRSRARRRARGLRRQPWQRRTSAAGQRQAGRGAGRAPHAPHPFPARRPRPHRPAHRLRHLALRRLHRRPRRPLGEGLHHLRRPGRRRRDHHDRGHRRPRRRPPRPAGHVPRAPRPAVRLLHPRDDHPRLAPAAGNPRPERGGDPLRHVGQPLPLHRLPEHRQGDPAAPPTAPAPTRRPRNDRAEHDPRRARREAPGPRLLRASASRTPASPQARAATSTT